MKSPASTKRNSRNPTAERVRAPERKGLWHIPEPLLEFAHGQMVEYPRDGLYLFGPCDAQKRPGTTRYGVIGTREGVERFGRFSEKMRGYIPIPAPGLRSRKVEPQLADAEPILGRIDVLKLLHVSCARGA